MNADGVPNGCQTLRPSQQTRTLSIPVGYYHLHPPVYLFVTIQPKGCHSHPFNCHQWWMSHL